MSVHVSPSAPETKADPHGFLENHALLENKAARPASDAEVGAAMGELSRAFEAFKETNDGRLAELEGRRSGDVLTEEKLARIDAALDSTRTRLDRLTLDGRRPPLGGDGPDPSGPGFRRAQGRLRPLCPGGRERRAEAPGGEGALGPAPAPMAAISCRRPSNGTC